MRSKFALTVAVAIIITAPIALASPSLAATVMTPGTTMTVMPNGQTMLMATPKGRISVDMMEGAMPMDKCVIMTMGEDGKMMMATDSMLPTGMMACDELSKMKQ